MLKAEHITKQYQIPGGRHTVFDAVSDVSIELGNGGVTPWRSFLKIRLTDKEIDKLEDSLGYETSMNSGACEIPIDKHDLMDLAGTTYF